MTGRKPHCSHRHHCSCDGTHYPTKRQVTTIAFSVLIEGGCIVLAIYEKPVQFLQLAAATNRTPAPNVLLAVNGTLMRGLELNPNLIRVGAVFVRETTTAPVYRLWSIGDLHPAMMRSESGGASIALEIWSVPAEGLASILQKRASRIVHRQGPTCG